MIVMTETNVKPDDAVANSESTRNVRTREIAKHAIVMTMQYRTVAQNGVCWLRVTVLRYWPPTTIWTPC